MLVKECKDSNCEFNDYQYVFKLVITLCDKFIYNQQFDAMNTIFGLIDEMISNLPKNEY